MVARALDIPKGEDGIEVTSAQHNWIAFQNLSHAAISSLEDRPIVHMKFRMEKGIREGGFGLLIAKQMVDEVIFNESRNEVIMIK
jgi:hypothetical protein